MKKIFGMLLILVGLYLGIQLAFRFFGNGHEYEYQVTTNDVKFTIKEKFVNNTNEEVDSYYFEISGNGSIFYYQTLADFGKKDYIIEDIYSFKNDEYNCILPIFKGGKIISDIMCLKDNTIYNYHTIEPTSDLQTFASELADYGYDASKWLDNSQSMSQDNVTIYPNNIIKNHHLGLANYKGVYIVNGAAGKELQNIELFKSDVYKRPLSMVFNNYYVTVNYNEQYRFTKILVVDLTSNKTREISCNADISFDSYIQGIYDDSIYLFDRSSKKQYEINLKTNKVLEVGNEASDIVMYTNGEKSRVAANDAKNKDIIFINKIRGDLNIEDYIKIDSVGGKTTGYYYLYKKAGNKYNVYRANVKNTNQLTYLLSTTDLNRVVYHNEYIYYLDGNTIKYYSDYTGIKSVITYSELSFNNSLIFGIYVK